MKKICFTLVLLVAAISLSGQEVKPDTTKREYKNVVGIDATTIIRQFINFNSNAYFSSPYMISYKRIIKSNAIRLGLYGNLATSENSSSDTFNVKTTSFNVNIGLGFEHYSYLTKRWNLYFGADLITKYNENQSEHFSAYDSNTQRSTNFGLGISPLIGIQFRINSRLSLSTESSYDILFVTSKNHFSYNSYPYNRNQKRTGINTQFNAPASINFRIQF
jgi:hypothetical protein